MRFNMYTSMMYIIRVYIIIWCDFAMPKSFYDSPPNFSFMKLPVLKPSADRISCKAVPRATPTSPFDCSLQTRKRMKTAFS